MINNLSDGRLINWEHWRFKDFPGIVKSLVSFGCCKYTKNEIEMYRRVHQWITTTFEPMRRPILKGIMDRTPGMKEYLYMHSWFPEGAIDSGDWLVHFMATYLDIKEEIDELNKKRLETFPKDLLKQFEMFDPEPVFRMKDPIRIEYHYEWPPISDDATKEERRARAKKYSTPIEIIDTDWENHRTNVMKQDDLERELSSFDVISTADIPETFPENDSYYDDSDLPF